MKISHKIIFLILPLFLCVSSGCNAYEIKKSISGGVTISGIPNKERLANIDKEIGFRPIVINFFISWPTYDSNEVFYFPDKAIDAITSYGSIPCISWEPMIIKDRKENMIEYMDILSGKYDEYLYFFAERLKKYDCFVMIRFAHEMNLKRYHWGTNKSKYGQVSQKIYINMFRYIVDFFKKNEVKNVKWVFCPNSESVPQESVALWNTLEGYFPGENYVDIIGLDGYNWGNIRKKDVHGWNSSWRSFEEIFARPILRLRKISDKPFIIFETASTYKGGNKKKWLENMNSALEKYDIKAFCWFQEDKETDWRMGSGLKKKYIWNRINERRYVFLREAGFEKK